MARPIASHASTSMPACRFTTALASETVNASKTGTVPSSHTTLASEGIPKATHMPPAASVTAARTSNARSIDQRIRDMTIFPIAAHGGFAAFGSGCGRGRPVADGRLRTAWHQSRKHRGSTVDLRHGEARHANGRHGALLDVSQAAGAFRQHNRSMTPERLGSISC
ncbi:hypothetical protein [Burkholderia sp. AU28863]|uniref:hypothetical protein n=1 Tax=Burkholderia sp. AU28863 TaxID=2015352 RepID=UPI00211B2F90|nr:hypothetical protein [Burkholderia sp. AU28863]